MEASGAQIHGASGTLVRPLSVLAVTNMYPTPDAPGSGAFVKSQIDGLRGLGYAVDVLHLDRLRGGRSVYRRIPERLTQALAQGPYDLVHVMYGGVMADRVTQASTVPSVVSFCGSDLNGTPRAPLPSRIAAWFGVRASKRAARRARAVIAKTEQLAERLPRNVPRDKVSVIPSGVDLDRFRRMERDECIDNLGWDHHIAYVLFYGWEPGKRPELAREAVVLANAQAGRTVELKALSGVPHEQVPVWINACSAVLVTSAHEGSPNIVKEALACDVPVVSTDVGDVRQRLSPVAGCHIVPADAMAVAKALTDVLQGTGRVEGRAAVEDISLERVACRVAEVYRRALAQS